MNKKRSLAGTGSTHQQSKKLREPNANVEKEFVPVITSNFYPKFDNQNKDKLLHPSISENPKGILSVSKKHSGSLVLAPPFYSKNGVANEFSRMGKLLLQKHFDCVWPGEGQRKFKDWWAHADLNGLSYTFECVVPRVLGDHGATPKAAYLVLICVSWTLKDMFLSPADLLTLGTLWRLPLNETWYIKHDLAYKVESLLHSKRWSIDDTQINQLLDKYSICEPQRFLSHLETQGDVLEGFVLIALVADSSSILQLVGDYNNEMQQFKAGTLREMLRFGSLCLRKDEQLLKQLKATGVNDDDEPCHDSKGNLLQQEQGVNQNDVWDLVLNCCVDNKVQELFRRLATCYKHKVTLKQYYYRGECQIQIQVRDDQLFYGWSLHANDGSTSRLYRGMVVTLFRRASQLLRESRRKQAEQQGRLFQADTVKMQLVGMAKLKCLNYIWRTFGIRNRVGVLHSQGKQSYLSLVRRQVFGIWGVPPEQRRMLDQLVNQFADHFLSGMSKPERTRMLNGEYLQVLEAWLKTLPSLTVVRPLSSPAPSRQPATSPPVAEAANPFANNRILIINLTKSYNTIDLKFLTSYGLAHMKRSKLLASLQPGTYCVVNRLPSIQEIKPDSIVLCFDLRFKDANADIEQQVLEESTALGAKIKAQSIAYLLNASRADWKRFLDTEFKPAKAQAAAITKPPPKPKPLPVPANSKTKYLLVVAGLPPGGGKSTFFRQLAKHADGARVVSSDNFADKRDKFEAAVRQAISSGTVTCYDKNVPDVTSLKRLLKVLHALPNSLKQQLRVVVICPSVLQHDLFWKRVILRGVDHIGLNIHNMQASKGSSPKQVQSAPIPREFLQTNCKVDTATLDHCYRVFKTCFYDQCLTGLVDFLKAPAVLVTNCFVLRDSELRSFTQSVLSQMQHAKFGCSVEQLSLWADSVPTERGGSNAKPSWVGIELDDTAKTHLTLVPPHYSTRDSDESRQAALDKYRDMAGARVRVLGTYYHVAYPYTSNKGSYDKETKVGFWEVDEVHGIKLTTHYPKQSQVYHITDIASISNLKAKDAYEAMSELRLDENAGRSFHVETEVHKLDVQGRIKFYY